MKLGIVIVAASALVAAPLSAQSPAVGQAIAVGQVGERYDGYMGFAASPSPEVRRQVSAINIRRRNLYIGLAGRRNVTPGAATRSAGSSADAEPIEPAGESLRNIVLPGLPPLIVGSSPVDVPTV